MSPKRNNTLASRDLPMRAFSKSLPMELLRAREAVMRRFRPELRNHGVTEQQWRILPDMEARQLIGRRQADSDLRRSVISLERNGLRVIALHAPNAERIYDEIAQQFGPEKIAQLFTLLHELEQSLVSQGDAPSHSRSRAKPRAPATRRAR